MTRQQVEVETGSRDRDRGSQRQERKREQTGADVHGKLDKQSPHDSSGLGASGRRAMSDERCGAAQPQTTAGIYLDGYLTTAPPLWQQQE